MTVPQFVTETRTGIVPEFKRLHCKYRDEVWEALDSMILEIRRYMPSARRFKHHEKMWGCSFDYQDRRWRVCVSDMGVVQLKTITRKGE